MDASFMHHHQGRMTTTIIDSAILQLSVSVSLLPHPLAHFLGGVPLWPSGQILPTLPPSSARRRVRHVQATRKPRPWDQEGVRPASALHWPPLLSIGCKGPVMRRDDPSAHSAHSSFTYFVSEHDQTTGALTPLLLSRHSLVHVHLDLHMREDKEAHMGNGEKKETRPR